MLHVGNAHVGLSLLTLAVSLLVGCSASPRVFASSGAEYERRPSPSANSETPKYEVEVVTIEQQAREDILHTPLEFFLSPSSVVGAENRVNLFFRQFLEEPAPQQQELQPKGVRFTHGGVTGQKNFRYSVDFIPSGRGTAVFVNCSPTRIEVSSQSAELNAKNLSRFIREGTLELSLLKQ
ncbi:MAG: hypothetical protein KDD64_10655 [Bdellovibrionales bacterium]|nr:hypothetical protein [Bdellovibrionales bacterium]